MSRREPITGANVDRALDGPAISEEDHEVALMEERAVATAQTVPKERVRMEKNTGCPAGGQAMNPFSLHRLEIAEATRREDLR